MAGTNAKSKTNPWKANRRANNPGIARRTVIVLDASVVVELLTKGALADSITRDLVERNESLIAPHLIDIEVTSALRKLVAGNRIDSYRSEQFLEELAMFPAERYAHTSLLGRIWELRHNFTAYDAAYIALAEATNAVLYTIDQKLCNGHRAQVFCVAN
jgi:predicted nucleic acid-binding protein